MVSQAVERFAERRGGVETLKVSTPANWIPRDIPGLQFWIGPPESQVWKESTRVTPAVIGNTIGAVDDLSRNARHATQATPANEPTYTANQFNGRPGMVFTVAQSLNYSNSISFTGDISLVILTKSIKTSTWAASFQLKETATNYFIKIDSNATTDSGRVLINTSGASGQSAPGPAINIKDGNPHVLIATYNRSTAKANLYVDGVVGTERAVVGVLPTVFDLVSVFSNYGDYTTSDALIYDKVLSLDEIQTSNNYFS